MKDGLIYITDGITFQDLRKGTIKKSEVYLKQMKNWFIKPARILLENSKETGDYENELPLLTILITFFESHGQYLNGTSSHGDSNRVFQCGFNAYLDYLITVKKHDNGIYRDLDRRKFYTLVRCGLLHNGYIKNDGVSFFIDRFKIDNTHVIYPNKIIHNSWLINTKNMLDCIEDYLSHYINLIETEKEYKNKFEKMFETFYNID
ncbi:hypothetical protein ACE3MQ_14145 [Paenibacillus lentus]|uniref:hypothetical protein n=1 Tax=Paenibacillus lentus TaxID=1338368 RepID=UPI00365C5C51